MDDDLVRAAQLQSWRAWRRPEGRHCKLLCDLPPPEDEASDPVHAPRVDGHALQVRDADEVGLAKKSPVSEREHEDSEGAMETRRSRGESLWPPVLTVGIVVLLLFGAQELDKASPGNGRTLLVAVLGLLAVLGFFYMVLGKTVRETGKNAWSAVRSVTLFIALALTFGALAQCVGILPDRGAVDSGTESWNRR